jgi:hypothetical protein
VSKILLLALDGGKIPNVALKKVELYHQELGDEVIWDMPLMREVADKIYVSCIFDENKDKCKEWEGIADIGGTGYSLTKVLPPEIEVMKPKINIGFTSRGCVRRCPYCVVPIKEGLSHKVGDIYDFWDGLAKEITILDPNILSLPTHFREICGQIKKESLRVDFNAGLDVRFLTDETAKILKSIKRKDGYSKFAWDLDEDLTNKFAWLRETVGKSMVYIIVGFLPLEKILWKVETLKKMGHIPYIMRHKSVYFDPEYVTLAQYVNQPNMLFTKSYEEFKKFAKERNKIEQETQLF